MFGLLSSQDLGFENESESTRLSREKRSQELMMMSLSNPTDYSFDDITDDNFNVYYFKDKMSCSMIMDSSEFYNSMFFPYSSRIDKSFLGSQKSYYKVYYDVVNRLVREDYFESGKIVHYILYFYEDYYNVRTRVCYFSDTDYNITYDYFNFREDNARVEIKYRDNYIDFIKVEYKTPEGNVINIEQYNDLLEKNGVWYFYDEKVILVKKEFWRNGALIKYFTCGDGFKRTYYRGDGSTISKDEFYNIK